MPGIVIGEKREVQGGPGELSQASLERARKALDELKKQKERDKKPKPDYASRPTPKQYLHGYQEPKWSTSQSRWVSCVDNEAPKWKVWDQGKWVDLDIFERSFELKAPDGHQKLSKNPTGFWKRCTTFIFGGGKG
jgi:hypothetical protein